MSLKSISKIVHIFNSSWEDSLYFCCGDLFPLLIAQTKRITMYKQKKLRLNLKGHHSPSEELILANQIIIVFEFLTAPNLNKLILVS